MPNLNMESWTSNLEIIPTGLPIDKQLVEIYAKGQVETFPSDKHKVTRQYRNLLFLWSFEEDWKERTIHSCACIDNFVILKQQKKRTERINKCLFKATLTQKSHSCSLIECSVFSQKNMYRNGSAVDNLQSSNDFSLFMYTSFKRLFLSGQQTLKCT